MTILDFKPNAIVRAMTIAALGSTLALPAVAQTDGNDEEATEIERIVVTATRREGSIQDVPINIAALDGKLLEQRGIGDISEALRFVPGIVAIDQGGRNGNPIIVRGINADPLGQGRR